MNVVFLVYVAVFEVVSSLNAGLSPVYRGNKKFFCFFACIVGKNKISLQGIIYFYVELKTFYYENFTLFLVRRVARQS